MEQRIGVSVDSIGTGWIVRIRPNINVRQDAATGQASCRHQRVQSGFIARLIRRRPVEPAGRERFIDLPARCQPHRHDVRAALRHQHHLAIRRQPCSILKIDKAGIEPVEHVVHLRAAAKARVERSIFMEARDRQPVVALAGDEDSAVTLHEDVVGIAPLTEGKHLGAVPARPERAIRRSIRIESRQSPVVRRLSDTAHDVKLPIRRRGHRRWQRALGASGEHPGAPPVDSKSIRKHSTLLQRLHPHAHPLVCPFKRPIAVRPLVCPLRLSRHV